MVNMEGDTTYFGGREGSLLDQDCESQPSHSEMSQLHQNYLGE